MNVWMLQYQGEISFGNKPVLKTAVRLSCCCLVQCYTQSTTGREIQLMAKPAEYQNTYEWTTEKMHVRL